MAGAAVQLLGGQVSLRPYQQAAADLAIEWMRKSALPFCIDAATGAGKSHIIAEIARVIHGMTGKRVLCLAPSSELVVQNRLKFLATGNPASMFSASAGAKELRHPVVFGSPLTVKNRISRFQQSGDKGYALVIVDECFTGDTLVSTPRGQIPIKSLRNGDIVCNAVGSGEVETVFTKAVEEIYYVTLTNGTVIRCTGSHPFFTEKGWCQASELEGKIVFSKEDVSCLLNYFRAETDANEKQGWQPAPDNEPNYGSELGQTDYLFSILREEMEEPYAQRFIAAKGKSYIEAHRAQATSDMGEWARADSSATGSFGYIGGRVGCRASNINGDGAQKRDISKRIQGGFSVPGKNDSIGSGWGKPRDPCTSGGRQKKGRTSCWVRVESVSCVKLESPEIVYNLHISGHPSYFAGGVLVHNCHGLTPTLKSIIEAMREGNPNLRVCGLTATPYRLGSGYIFRQHADGKINGDDTARDPYFTKCVYRVDGRELIAQGYLTKPVIGEINADGYETAGMALNSRGQFDAEAVDRAYHGHGRKTAAIVADVVGQSAARQGVMFFAATVQHAKEIMASLPPELTALVTGETPKAQRDNILVRFKAKTIKYLVNVSVLTTGFDAPHVDVIAILRKTESVGLLQQIIGRGLRLNPGKTDCLILDYTDNLDDHCPDGDLFAPEIKAGKGPSGEGGMGCTCPSCAYENTFTANPVYLEYKKDEAGYILDLDGNQVQSEFGPIAGHFGRRCMGLVQSGARGEFERCGYRWTFKPCPHCDADNDIAARYCRECKGEIVDPNDKLKSDFKALKRDPTQMQTDAVTSMVCVPGMSRAGNKTMKVEWATPYRQFTTWLQPEAKHTRGQAEWAAFDAITNGGTVAPRSVTYRKNAETNFFEIKAFNREPDHAPQ